ncbi:penicillin-binding protein [Streptomyces resistomycificus]|uniref:Penicillin-binding protein n=1 Tax=Streptomyces resistomycificus TaxID=67356 RepID=A0A0L8LWZ7_9ACTN|nr:penicillin-binding protein [Streptomyces resistomycificus]
MLPGPADTPPGPRLEAAVAAVAAPDVVFALSRDGQRTVRCGGTAPPPPVPRERLRYELGSASKAFTGLLLAELTRSGRLSGGEPAAALLDPRRRTDREPITLAHLITHTSGLPGLPRDFFRRALPAWHTNPYARYADERVVDAFLAYRQRRRPGTHWHYSNFGVAVLGHALAAATGVSWEELLTRHVLLPLHLDGVAPHPGPAGTDATGHRRDGTTPTPALDAGGFQAAGAVRGTPEDLLAFVEAHVRPSPTPLAAALHAVRRPVLRRGLGHRHVHTMGWFQHPTAYGPLYFHCGATLGQQAFLGFCPGTGTALVAACTRRFRARDTFVATAYGLLAEP